MILRSSLSRPGESLLRGSNSLWSTIRTSSFRAFSSDPEKSKTSGFFDIFPQEDEDVVKSRTLKRNLILQEMWRGPSYDVFRFEKDKHWIGGNGLIEKEEAVFFPNLEVIHVADKKKTKHFRNVIRDKVTLLTFSTVGTGSQQFPQWLDPVYERFGKELKDEKNEFQHVDLMYMQGFFLNLFQKFYLDGNMKSRREEVRRNFLFRAERTPSPHELFCYEIGVKNKVQGYVFLLDKEGNIRWRSHGKAQEGEVDGLLSCIGQLAFGERAPLSAAPSFLTEAGQRATPNLFTLGLTKVDMKK